MADRDTLVHGLLVKAVDGNARINPLVLVSRRAAEDMLGFAGEFGLTSVALRPYLGWSRAAVWWRQVRRATWWLERSDGFVAGLNPHYAVRFWSWRSGDRAGPLSTAARVPSDGIARWFCGAEITKYLNLEPTHL